MKPRCYNRPPFKNYAPSAPRWTNDGRRFLTYVPDPMSKDCKQHAATGEATLHPERGDCEGCRWKPEGEIHGD